VGLLTVIALGCGDGVFIVAFNSGTIVSDPFCGSGAGHFDLQNQGGLVLLVVITSNTKIFAANGTPGRCGDLTAGAFVGVRGPRRGTQVTAESVSLQ